MGSPGGMGELAEEGSPGDGGDDAGLCPCFRGCSFGLGVLLGVDVDSCRLPDCCSLSCVLGLPVICHRCGFVPLTNGL